MMRLGTVIRMMNTNFANVIVIRLHSQCRGPQVFWCSLLAEFPFYAMDAEEVKCGIPFLVG